ncbi:MAG: hypothetical protein PHQ41_02320 [Candidatus Cloacimonetes bacterium]|nr:hypothetical protein [Candidatus Cloacimonadota bacterium]
MAVVAKQTAAQAVEQQPDAKTVKLRVLVDSWRQPIKFDPYGRMKTWKRRWKGEIVEVTPDQAEEMLASVRKVRGKREFRAFELVED